MIYIVDIDDTICKMVDKETLDYTKNIPYYERIKHFNSLYDDGHEIHYWTARGAVTGIDWYDVTEKQLNEWGAKYHSLRVGDKPHYDYWIDDKAINVETYFGENK